MLRIGLQEANEHLLFQYSDPFAIIYQGRIIFKGRAKENYLLELDNESIYISSRDQKIKLGDSKLEYQLYSSQENSIFLS